MCKPVQVTAGAMLVSAIGPKATLTAISVAGGGVALYVAVATAGVTVVAVAAVATLALLALPVLLARRAHRSVSPSYQSAPARKPARTTIRLEAHTIPALAEAPATPDAITAHISAPYLSA